MSQLSASIRGYRQALRDVQREAILYGHTLSSQASVSSAVFAAANDITVPLRQLRDCLRDARGSDSGERVLPFELAMSDVAGGYQAGFEQAIECLADHGRRMKNPAARAAIGEAINRLQNVRSQLIIGERGILTGFSGKWLVI